jgi:quercetin dioxygenase-like cupin family protein
MADPTVALIINRPGDGERFVRSNRTVTIRLELPELSIHEVEFDTTFGVSQHRHDHVDALYVLDGEIEFVSGNDVIRAGRDTFIAAPPGTCHGFRNPGPCNARVLFLHAPDGGFSEVVRRT